MPRNRSALAVTAFFLACNAADPPSAPDAQPLSPGAPTPSGTGANGKLVRTGYAVTGTATLVVNNGTARLDFSGDFTVGSAPGPFVYVNTTNNANTGKPLRIAALKSRTGAQSYSFQVPAGVSYTWILIWCDPFNVSIAEAAIQATP